MICCDWLDGLMVLAAIIDWHYIGVQLGQPGTCCILSRTETVNNLSCRQWSSSQSGSHHHHQWPYIIVMANYNSLIRNTSPCISESISHDVLPLTTLFWCCCSWWLTVTVVTILNCFLFTDLENWLQKTIRGFKFFSNFTKYLKFEICYT